MDELTEKQKGGCMYKYSDRKKKIPASQFGLPGRHAFPIPDFEKASKEINKIMHLMEFGMMNKKDGRKLINKHDEVLFGEQQKMYKKWLKKYHLFTRSLDVLHRKFAEGI